MSTVFQEYFLKRFCVQDRDYGRYDLGRPFIQGNAAELLAGIETVTNWQP